MVHVNKDLSMFVTQDGEGKSVCVVYKTLNATRLRLELLCFPCMRKFGVTVRVLQLCSVLENWSDVADCLGCEMGGMDIAGRLAWH